MIKKINIKTDLWYESKGRDIFLAEKINEAVEAINLLLEWREAHLSADLKPPAPAPDKEWKVKHRREAP